MHKRAAFVHFICGCYSTTSKTTSLKNGGNSSLKQYVTVETELNVFFLFTITEHFISFTRALKNSWGILQL